jgi:hypothetical protein
VSPPARIRNASSYRGAQPDLDAYAECFEDLVASRRFAGSDVDGLFAAGHVVHGVWERHGHVLVLEHKASPRSWASSRGQWYALNTLAAIGREHRPDARSRRLVVIVTYGEDPSRPDAWAHLPIPGWERGVRPHRTRSIDWSDRESIPLRKWIRMVVNAQRGRRT